MSDDFEFFFGEETDLFNELREGNIPDFPGQNTAPQHGRRLPPHQGAVPVRDTNRRSTGWSAPGTRSQPRRNKRGQAKKNYRSKPQRRKGKKKVTHQRNPLARKAPTIYAVVVIYGIQFVDDQIATLLLQKLAEKAPTLAALGPAHTALTALSWLVLMLLTGLGPKMIKEYKSSRRGRGW